MDDDDEINRLLGEFGLELPDLEDDAPNNGLPPTLDDLEDWMR